jgi:exosortase
MQAISEHAENHSLSPKGSRGIFVGASFVLLGLAARMLTVLLPSLILQSLSMLTVAAGLVLLIGGRTWWRLLWPSLLFAVFMIPLPSAIYSRIAFPLQLFVSQLSTVVLEILGIPVHRDGNLIHLPGQVMHVAEACSGLRQLTAFIAICTCAALLMKRPGWYRAALLASSIPIAVLINILRVTATGLMLRYGNAEWTEGSLHTIEGLVMVGLGLLVLRLEIALLDWLLVNDEKPSHQIGAAQPA